MFKEDEGCLDDPDWLDFRPDFMGSLLSFPVGIGELDIGALWGSRGGSREVELMGFEFRCLLALEVTGDFGSVFVFFWIAFFATLFQRDTIIHLPKLLESCSKLGGWVFSGVLGDMGDAGAILDGHASKR